MSPIKGVSELRRMPRLGKIRLGIKVEEPKKNPYPRPTDYFVLPDAVKKYLGDRPTRLPIMFPTENQSEFAPQFLKCYSFTQGLVCRGDGVRAMRKVDTATGDIVNHNTREWVFQEITCDPDTCPQYMGDPERAIRPQCRRVMNLIFLIPDVPGFGVWQLDTSSFYSIVNINSCLDLIRRICGRISFIPLQLSLEPMEVTPPGVKRKTVHILYVRSDVKLADIQKLGRIPPERVLLPPVEDEDEAPADLFPPETLAEAEQALTAPASEESVADEEKKEESLNDDLPLPESSQEKTPDDVVADDVPDLNALFRVCFHFWRMQPNEVCRHLGYRNQMDAHSAVIKPWESFLAIKRLKQEKRI
ncbi:MAG: hypothetical protein N3E40_02820 [Dehalococcoidia bacterium]|nr:hypothetical protein [Dehalococcoidia bacterium]